MEKDDKLNGLNLGADDSDEEDGDEETAVSAKELKRLQAVEKSYKDSQNEGQMYGHFKKVKADNSYLIKLAETDKPMATKLVKEFYGITLEQALAKIKGGSKKKDDEEEDGDPTEKIAKKVKDDLQAEGAKELYNKFLEDKGLDSDKPFYKDFKREFDDQMEGRAWTKERVEKACRLALSEAKKVSKFASEYKETEKALGRTGISSQGQTTEKEVKKEDNRLLQGWKSNKGNKAKLLEKHNILKRK